MTEAVGALVRLEGRVLTPQGLALRNAVVSLVDAFGSRRNVTTGPFGIFTIEDITIGATYTLTANSKRYRFSSRSITVAADMSVGDITGL